MHRFREPVSGFTHLFGAIFALLGLCYLIAITRHDMATMLTMFIYGVSAVLVYVASALLHLSRGFQTQNPHLPQARPRFDLSRHRRNLHTLRLSLARRQCTLGDAHYDLGAGNCGDTLQTPLLITSKPKLFFHHSLSHYGLVGYFGRTPLAKPTPVRSDSPDGHQWLNPIGWGSHLRT